MNRAMLADQGRRMRQKGRRVRDDLYQRANKAVGNNAVAPAAPEAPAASPSPPQPRPQVSWDEEEPLIRLVSSPMTRREHLGGEFHGEYRWVNGQWVANPPRTAPNPHARRSQTLLGPEPGPRRRGLRGREGGVLPAASMPAMPTGSAAGLRVSQRSYLSGAQPPRLQTAEAATPGPTWTPPPPLALPPRPTADYWQSWAAGPQALSAPALVRA
eukprot:EG_transcript_22205